MNKHETMALFSSQTTSRCKNNRYSKKKKKKRVKQTTLRMCDYKHHKLIELNLHANKENVKKKKIQVISPYLLME